MAKRIQNFRKFNSENDNATPASKKVGVGSLSDSQKRTTQNRKDKFEATTREKTIKNNGR